MAKSYSQVQSDYKFIAIIEFLFQQTGPVSGTAIARALDIPHGTVMSHLIPAVECKWVKVSSDLYEIGIRVPGMYSAYKMGLICQRDQIERKLSALEA